MQLALRAKSDLKDQQAQIRQYLDLLGHRVQLEQTRQCLDPKDQKVTRVTLEMPPLYLDQQEQLALVE